MGKAPRDREVAPRSQPSSLPHHSHYPHFLDVIHMASLQSLPNELLDSIITDLSFRDVIRLAMTCKSLRALALPTAYHSIILEWKNATTQDNTAPEPPQPHKLLRTLIENPEYVKLVKSLEFRATHCLLYTDDGNLPVSIPSAELNIQEGEMALFGNTIDTLRLPEAEQWKSGMTENANSTVFMTLIVGICTHLESLSVSVDFLLQSDWFETPIDLSLCATKSTSGVAWLSQLSCLRVTGDADEDLWDEEFRDLQTTYLRLFYLPNLQMLELAAFSDDGAERSSWRRGQLPTPWPLDEHPLAEKLTTLRLVRSNVNWQTIDSLLKQTPNLHTFDYDCFQHPWSVAYSLDKLAQALRHIRSMLTHLVVRYQILQEDDESPPQDNFGVVSGSLGPLKDFTALKSLTVSLHVLFGYEDSQEDRFPTLGEYLPPHVQYLTVTDDLYMYSDFQQYVEDWDAMKIFRTYLSGEKVADDWFPDAGWNPRDNWDGGKKFSEAIWVTDREPEWRVATPELKEFVYDLRKEGHRSIGFWNVKGSREELKRVCEAQGIKCRVLWTEEVG